MASRLPDELKCYFPLETTLICYLFRLITGAGVPTGYNDKRSPLIVGYSGDIRAIIAVRGDCMVDAVAAVTCNV
ncbi:hypothetical protein SFRURICE_020713 [Spodoptera frugiperda]|nr:hypothetical protein SFRURICE_020713 [Spodoptera frugiperda]